MGTIFLDLSIFRAAPVGDFFFLTCDFVGALIGDSFFSELVILRGLQLGTLFFLELVILRGAPVKKRHPVAAHKNDTS